MKDIANKRLIACGACVANSGSGGGGGRGGGTGGAGYVDIQSGGQPIVLPAYGRVSAAPGASGTLLTGGNGGRPSYNTQVGVTPLGVPPLSPGAAIGPGTAGNNANDNYQGNGGYYSIGGGGGGGGGFGGSGGAGGLALVGYSNGTAGPAGPAGAAIAGNSFITWVGATGTRYGSVA